MTDYQTIRSTSLKIPPPRDCVFDSYHGTIGIDIYPFAVTTRVSASTQIFLKVYEDMDDPDKRKRMRGDGKEHSNG